MKKKIINILISVIITLFFVRAMGAVWSSGDVKSGIMEADPVLIACAAVCYVMTYPLRAFRIFYLTRKNNVTYGQILPVCFRHQFYGRIIPFKAGELSLVYLLKKRVGIPALEGGTTLIFLRVFDALVMVLSFITCNFFVDIGGLVSYIAAAVLVMLVLASAICVALFPRITAFFKRRKYYKAASVTESVFVMLKDTGIKNTMVIFVVTVVLWIFVYLSMHFVAAAFFGGLSIVHTVVASFLASAAAFLPVNGLGGFGTTEAGWTLGFMLIGMDKNTALISGVVSNMMSFVIVCVFGIVSFVKWGDGSVRDNDNQ